MVEGELGSRNQLKGITVIRWLFIAYKRLPYRFKYWAAKLSFLLCSISFLFPKNIKLGSYSMYLAGSDNAIFGYRYHLDHYEKTLIDSYLKFLSENPRSIAIDIGASYGAYSLKAANIGQYGLVKKYILLSLMKSSLTRLNSNIVHTAS